VVTDSGNSGRRSKDFTKLGGNDLGYTSLLTNGESRMRLSVNNLSIPLFAMMAVTPIVAGPIGFNVALLASDLPGVAATTDPGLLNAWGLAASAASPFWISANGSGTSVLYNGAGVKQGLVVTIPPGGTGTPTGIVFSNVGGSFNSDTFLFSSEDGTISGWRGALGTSAETLVGGSTANVYKGLTLGTVGASTYAYAANFRTGAIDVINGNGANPPLSGTFVDGSLPAGYAPFNIQNLGGVLYVTYAVQDGAKHDDVPGVGNGIVDKFDLNGNFLGRVVTGGALDSPWGLALAPAGFGDVAGDLLVGNFGDGMIHAYDPVTGTLLETLQDAGGNPIMIDGLWALRFGNGASSGSVTNLYFTAGPNHEADGLFGDLATVPEPGTWALAGLGLAVALLRKRMLGSPSEN
jgi:uncharacterized protein (TIGR03118 family)